MAKCFRRDFDIEFVVSSMKNVIQLIIRNFHFNNVYLTIKRIIFNSGDESSISNVTS